MKSFQPDIPDILWQGEREQREADQQQHGCQLPLLRHILRPLGITLLAVLCAGGSQVVLAAALHSADDDAVHHHEADEGDDGAENGAQPGVRHGQGVLAGHRWARLAVQDACSREVFKNNLLITKLKMA